MNTTKPRDEATAAQMVAIALSDDQKAAIRRMLRVHAAAYDVIHTGTDTFGMDRQTIEVTAWTVVNLAEALAFVSADDRAVLVVLAGDRS